MRLLSALGIGVLILVLQSLSPKVLTQGETTVISLLRTIEVVATSATTLSASVHEAGTVLNLHPPALPVMPSTRR